MYKESSRRAISSLPRSRGPFLLQQFLKLKVARIALFNSFLIMPLGQLLKRRLLRRIHHRQGKVCFAPARTKLNGFAQRCFGGSAIPFFNERFAEEILGARFIWNKGSRKAQR